MRDAPLVESTALFEAVLVRPDAPLPAVCLTCGEPGVIPRFLSAPGALASNSLSVYDCERCAAADRRKKTLLFARWAGTSLLLTSVAAALLLEWGERFIGRQIVFLIALTALVCSLLERWCAKRAPEEARLEPLRDGELRLWVPRSAARALETAGVTPVAPQPTVPRRQPRPLGYEPFVSFALPIAFWTLGQLFGRAVVHVVDGSPDGVLLLDDRFVSTIPWTSYETPHAGLHPSLMSGERRLAIYRLDGSLAVSIIRTLKPGHHYLLASAPAGFCFYWESQAFGNFGGGHDLQPLPKGQTWLDLGAGFERYLEPTPEAERAGSRGGVASALRLLPCSGSRADTGVLPLPARSLAERRP